MDEIINGDCLEVMNSFPDQSFDLVYADPPFNAGNIGTYSRTYDQYTDDLPPIDYAAFCSAWFSEARRVGKKLIITPGVGNIGLYPNPYWCAVISKPSSPSFNRMGGFNCWEPLFVYDKPVPGARLPRDLVVFDSQNFIKDGRDEHPCPDNLEMVKWIVTTWSEEGQSVLDPFVGSGSGAVAAKHLKRQYVGIDVSRKYCEIARDRLAQDLLF
jgi:site-specific DNA-methyltransferase (adenine-specific)